MSVMGDRCEQGRRAATDAGRCAACGGAGFEDVAGIELVEVDGVTAGLSEAPTP